MNVDTDLTITAQGRPVRRGRWPTSVTSCSAVRLEPRDEGARRGRRRWTERPHRRAPRPGDSPSLRRLPNLRRSRRRRLAPGTARLRRWPPNGATGGARKVESRGRADRPARNGRGAGAQASAAHPDRGDRPRVRPPPLAPALYALRERRRPRISPTRSLGRVRGELEVVVRDMRRRRSLSATLRCCATARRCRPATGSSASPRCAPSAGPRPRRHPAATAAVPPDELDARTRYAAERDGAAGGGPRPSCGVGGTRTGIKCLHAHYAWYLAGGDDPVGRWVAQELSADPRR